MVVFQKDVVTKSKSQKCKTVEVLTVLGGKSLQILLQMEENRRLVLQNELGPEPGGWKVIYKSR